MTSSTEAAMVEADWQARAQRRKARWYATCAILLGMGLLTGFLLGYFEKDGTDLMAANSIPTSIAILTVLIMGVALTVGQYYFVASSDELERRNMLNAVAMSGNVILVGFPLWFILWKGGLVPAPDAFALFAAAYAANIATYFWYKFR